MQLLFHSLAARVVLLSSVLLAQLWYFLMVWVPTAKEYQALQQTIRCILSGKSCDSGSRSSRVAWSKVVQAKEDGRLGVVDPVIKAKALQTQWLLCSLTPGDEP